MSFNRYHEYKDSGTPWLGDVPAHWGVEALKRSLRLLTEKTDRRRNPVALENVESWSGRFLPTTTEFEGEGVAFERGDILFGKLRPYLAKAYLADAAGEAVGDFHVIRPLDAVSPKFAQYQLLTREFIEIVDGSTFGSKMPRASWEFVGNVKLASPPIEEQNQIASFLDCETAKIDALVAEQQKLIVLLKEKGQAFISQAVTKGLNSKSSMKDSNVSWLEEIPAHWQVRTVAKASLKITNGYVGPTRDILIEAGVPYIQATHIKGGKIQFSEDYYVRIEWSEAHAKSILREGDVLIVQTGAGTGDVGLVSHREEGFNCHALIIIASDKEVIVGAYLYAVLSSAYGQAKLRSIQTGAMHPHLNCGEVKFVELPIPTIEEQKEIVQFINEASYKFNALISEAQSAITLLGERRTALISAAVTGKIDVRASIAQPEAVA